MRAQQRSRFPEYRKVLYTTTRLGGGVTPQGVSYPGGLDLTTPSLSLQPGAVVNGVNFECSQSGGYARIKGYERYDGQAAPSAAQYSIVTLSAAGFTNVPAIGATISQASSGATGTVIAVNNVQNQCYIVVTQVVGGFDYSGQIKVSTTVIGTATTPTSSVTPKQNAVYLAAAADVYRALIGAVPGSGKILGVVQMVFSGVDNVYAFRANVGNTAVNLYKSTSSGWTQVPFLDQVSFTAGTAPGGAGTGYEPPDGVTITQGGVTATVKRVMWQAGSFNANSATGKLIITAPSGGNFASGSASLSDGSTVTLSGVQTAISLLPGGRFEFTKANFSGQPSTRRIYGCDGVNKAFEFDGTILAPIDTGLSPDAPSHITSHRNYLILSQQGSLIGCAAGMPFKWSAVDGAWEIAVGDTVTGFVTVPGSQSTATLAVFMRTNSGFLYGTDPTTFNFVIFNTGLGSLQYSVQNLFDTFFFDDLGIVTMRTTLNWGNFLPNALSKNIQPFIVQERSKLTASGVCRSKSQYRVFFSDGYGLYLTMVNQQYLGLLPVLFTNPVYVMDEGETQEGNEVSYFGSNDNNGYVYQMDSGTGFDGASINAFITLAWDPIKTPRILKRYRAASIEVQGNNYAEITIGYTLGYGSTLIAQPATATYPSNFSGSFWDSFTWDNFVWDGQTLAPTDISLVGTAENVQYTLTCSGNYIESFNINSVITHYSMGRGIRP